MDDPTPPTGDRFDLPGDFRDSQVNIKSPTYHYHLSERTKSSEADLEAAERRLAELPTGEMPKKPSPLPPGSRMHLQVNPLFVGREDHLRHLAKKLQVERGAVAITGIGGLGKTQLASRFVHTYGTYFQGGVFWLSFERADSIAAEVAACGGAGALDLHPSFGELPQEEQVRRVCAAWQSPLPRLLVFDNCEDEKLVGKWRPTTGGCRVLITSRTTEWSPELGVEVRSLGVLSRDESIGLLTQHRPDLAGAEDNSLDAVTDALGDLPLALHLAGSYLADLRHSRLGDPAAYLEALRQPYPLEHKSLTEGGYSPTGHEQHVAKTFALSYEQLDPDDPVDALARDLLARAACFAPGEPIPRDLLRATIEIEADDAEAETRVEDALRRLVKGLGLLEEDEAGAVVLHRLLGEFVMGVTEGFSAAQDAVEAAVPEEARRLNSAGYPAPLAASQGHLRAVADGAAERGSSKAGELSNTLGYHLDVIPDYEGARVAYQRAVEIFERTLGAEHPNVATAVNNLGSAFRPRPTSTAQETPSSGRSISTRRSSGLITPTSPPPSTTSAPCSRTRATSTPHETPSSERTRSSARAWGRSTRRRKRCGGTWRCWRPAASDGRAVLRPVGAWGCCGASLTPGCHPGLYSCAPSALTVSDSQGLQRTPGIVGVGPGSEPP